mmetsp:Transcript_110761/g.309532  ORF Transcript_110761/g.309532 Transcript_110761/m.309532 type:complete len:230 (-) Transcript_110761:247-936(-)
MLDIHKFSKRINQVSLFLVTRRCHYRSIHIILRSVIVPSIATIILDRSFNLQICVSLFPRLWIEYLMDSHSTSHFVIANVFDLIGSLLTDFLQIFQLKQDTGLCETTLHCWMRSCYHKSLRSIHQNVRVHLTIARLENIQHMLRVGCVYKSTQRKEWQDLGPLPGRRNLLPFRSDHAWQPSYRIDAISQRIFVFLIVVIIIVVVLVIIINHKATSRRHGSLRVKGDYRT